MACLPTMMSVGPSLLASSLRIFATANGSISPSWRTCIPLSAPIASAVLMVSWHCWTPTETAIISSQIPASLSLIACSTDISSKGFIDIFTFASSTPV